MFSGIGGFEIGIQKAMDSRTLLQEQTTKDIQDDSTNIEERQDRTTCIGYSEIDKYADQIYQKHFGGRNYGDATTINAEELPDFDMLVGGFPCQAFSIAGARKGFNDTRGTLFFDIARILKTKQPRLFVLENVKGLLNHDKGETFTTILQTIDELGYDVQWQLLNSKHFGVPQNRERVFFVGHLRGTSRPEVFPIRESNQEINLRPKIIGNTNNAGHGERSAVYSDEGIMGALTSTDYKQPKQIFVGTWRTHKDGQGFRENKEGVSPTIPARAREDGSGQPVIRAVLTPDRANKRQNGRRMKEPGEPSFTVTQQDIHGIYDGASIRRLTPVECERLQGFPDGWTDELSDTQRYKTLGNAVTTNVVQAVMERLFK
jgi:DNA (cytosine-5)-methyltransferase 1